MARIDRAALRQKIQELAGLSDDERAALLQLAAEGRSYGLVWEDRVEEVEERLREELPVLVEDASLRIIGQDTEHELPRIDHKLSDDNSRKINGNSRENESPNHILIEGDNLEALTALSYTHEGKVDVIYIDPPYNTGNKDFVYNDSFVDSEDSYRHSKWLSFMSKRLRIAKRLLSDRGVIFISIDDNEQANLKLLCDEVFGENNFVAQFVWVKKRKGSHLSKTTRSMTEYILCYAHTYSELELYGEAAYSDKLQPLAKRTNAHKTLFFPEMLIETTLEDGVYGGLLGNGSSALSFEDFEVKNKIVVSGCKVTGPFIWTQGKLDEELKLGTKVYLSSKFGFNVLRSDQDSKVKRPSTLIDSKNEVGTNEDAYEEIIDIFGEEGIMSYPKPVSLVKYLVNTIGYYYKDITVLDFFAGSGTTLHAVMQLNKEDGGKRQCILVTNNENNICREVTYERNKRVIEGYTTPKGVQVEGLHNNNLRYYRTKLLPRERTNRNMRRLVAASTDLLCIKEGIYSLTPNPSPIGEGSRMLTQNDVRLFSDGNRAMMVIYNEEVIPEVVEWLQTTSATNALTHSHNNAIKVYVFSPGAYAWDDDFAPVIDRVELCALPEAIYQAYKSVLPKKRVRRETAEGSPKEGGEE